MSLDLFSLEGKVALVTGGSKGLGLEMARALAVSCPRRGSSRRVVYGPGSPTSHRWAAAARPPGALRRELASRRSGRT